MKHNSFYFLFLILVNIFYCASNTTASPVINGIPDISHHFKFLVSIHRRIGSRYEYVCSGNIISERYILTAAHCFFGGTLNGAKIIAGTNLRNGPGIERDIIRVFLPGHTGGVPADLAVAELSADLDVHQHPDRLAMIPLGALDPHSNAGVHQRATLIGFGDNELVKHNGQSISRTSDNISRFMDLIILGRDEYPFFEALICGRNFDRSVFRTAYSGDSGAGLIYDNRIVGVLSHGSPNCDTLEAIAFTRLYEHMRFIEEAQNPHGNHDGMHILNILQR